MIEQFEIDYNGYKLLIEARCSKVEDKYTGSNTCEVDIISAYIIHDLNNLEQITLDDAETDKLTSMIAYMYVEENADRILH